MAEADEFAGDTTVASASPKKKIITMAILAGIVLMEGGGIFLVTKMMYQAPASADASAIAPEDDQLRSVQDEVELPLPEVNAFNKREGRLFLYNLQVTIRVRKDKCDDVEKILEARESTILDRFNTVIRGAETKYLNETGLDTIRRQFLFELNRILGDEELILELLIPKFFQSPADV
jgi:flagellar basal body-associated protein FliL